MAEFRQDSGKAGNGPGPGAEPPLAFGEFRFHPATGELWRGADERKLTPRAASVLALLARRALQLVTKEELHAEVWGSRAVGDDALTSCIQELRKALGDSARRPRLIETRHRRGYRLMVPLAVEPRTATDLIGRDAELGILTRCLEESMTGRRRLVLVSGEAGIGKSALVGTFLATLPAGRSVRIARGQCLAHHGLGEAFLPLIEAVDRLAGASDGVVARKALTRHAPSWLPQMPSAWRGGRHEPRSTGTLVTPERLLRELTLAIEAIAAETPLVLVIEDVHWSDASTIDWLAHVARRPEAARLLILVTARPADPATLKSSLGSVLSELLVHGYCRELSLEPMALDQVAEFLARRSGAPQPDGLARQLLERTGGNPLYMDSVVRQVIDAGMPMADALRSVPRDIRQFIERQIDDLPEGDRSLLTAASVIGREFAAAGVAAALEADLELVGDGCARLGRLGTFMRSAGASVWPDGTRSDLYTFRHDLYREVLYDRLSPTRLIEAHLRVGRRLETAWQRAPDSVAAELAEHFERGQDFARAIVHRQRAARKALRRSANAEAIVHLRRAQAVTGHVAEDFERQRLEVELNIALGAAYMAMRGFGAPEVQEAYDRASLLCDRLGERADLFPALWGQWLFRWGRADLDRAQRLGARLLKLGNKSGDSGLRLQAHHALWATAFGRGELKLCQAHAEAGMALYDGKRHAAMASSYGNHDPCACACSFVTMALTLSGRTTAARSMSARGLAQARSLDDPFSLAVTLWCDAMARQFAGDVEEALASAQESLELANEYGLALPRMISQAVIGWCTSSRGQTEEGLAQLERAIADLKASQSQLNLHYLTALLAEARLKAERAAEGLAAAHDGLALVEAGGDRFYLAELYRLKGAAEASLGNPGAARAALHKAIATAQAQGAILLEQKAQATLSALRSGPQ